VRKSLLVLSFGLFTLSALSFYAEHKRGKDRERDSAYAIEEVLKAQNQALAGRIFEGMSRPERDALLTLQRWKKKAKIRSFLSDTALTEPDAPRWIIMDGRRIRAAGVSDDALLEDALEDHLNASVPLALYHSKGKYYLFVKGSVDQTNFASAYVPEAFFASLRSDDGIRVWIALKDGTVIYHPLQRFIGSNAANIKPVAAGIQEMEKGISSPFVRTYLGLEGREAFGSWTPLPSLGVLVGSEWPKFPFGAVEYTFLFWFSLGFLFLGGLSLGFSFRPKATMAIAEQSFDESRLTDTALEYLENARSSAQKSIEALAEKEKQILELSRDRNDALEIRVALESRIHLLEEYQNTVLPKVTGKQVWSQLCQMLAKRNPNIVFVFYRYSPVTFSLVPESVHGVGSLGSEGVKFLQENRIYIGNPSYLSKLNDTEAYIKWSSKLAQWISLQENGVQSFPIRCSGTTGAILAIYNNAWAANGELDFALGNLRSLMTTTSMFCDSLGQLLQSMYAKGSARPSLASAPNDTGNRLSQPQNKL